MMCIINMIGRCYECQFIYGLQLRNYVVLDTKLGIEVDRYLRTNNTKKGQKRQKKEPFSVADCGVVSCSATSTTENKVEGVIREPIKFRDHEPIKFRDQISRW